MWIIRGTLNERKHLEICKVIYLTITLVWYYRANSDTGASCLTQPVTLYVVHGSSRWYFTLKLPPLHNAGGGGQWKG